MSCVRLLCNDSIYIASNITIHNLEPISAFMGKIGNRELGGLSCAEFKRRQRLHREAEIAAMFDVETFIHKSREIYGYDHFINDASGSLCELDHPGCIESLVDNTVIVYIQAAEHMEELVIERQRLSPKPLYYNEEFLDRTALSLSIGKGLVLGRADRARPIRSLDISETGRAPPASLRVDSRSTWLCDQGAIDGNGHRRGGLHRIDRG